MNKKNRKYEYDIRDYRISCGEKGEIFGKLYCPRGDEKFGVIILSHGFNGSHENFDYECGSFAENGYIAYAYDFRNGSVNSRSGNQTTEMTVFTEKEDLITVFEAIRGLKQADPSNIVLFGASQGGLVSALAAETLGMRVKAMALYFPAMNIPDDWRKKFTDENQIPETFDLWGMRLGRNYFTSIRNFYTFHEAGSFENPVLIIYGDQDTIVPMSAMVQAKNTYPDLELAVLRGEGHGFSSTGTKEAVKRILDFLA